MNLLVTGGCGFIGSNFINYYFHKNKSVNIINLDAMYYCASESNIYPEIKASSRYNFIKGNLMCMDLVTYILKSFKITHIIHFAAQSHVQNSFDDSLRYTSDNILGTHTLLEACRVYGTIKKFIHVSTDEVYGESINDDLKHEGSVLIPTNPYAATKAGAELIAMSYIKSYKLPIVITRGNNVYGPNQYPEKLIPLFIQQLQNNEQVTIQGNGSAKRSFLHVDDTCSAFEIILDRGKIGEIYNIGTPDEYTVLEVAEILVKLLKGTESFQSYTRFIEDRPFNDSRYFISNQKLVDLGWEIKIPFLEGIKKLVNGNK
jgi:UDP-glucose 4,6-dehydratase